MMLNLSSPVAPVIVIMTTIGATSVDKFDITTTRAVHCPRQNSHNRCLVTDIRNVIHVPTVNTLKLWCRSREDTCLLLVTESHYHKHECLMTRFRSRGRKTYPRPHANYGNQRPLDFMTRSAIFWPHKLWGNALWKSEITHGPFSLIS